MNSICSFSKFFNPFIPVYQRELHLPWIGHNLPLRLCCTGKNQTAAPFRSCFKNFYLPIAHTGFFFIPGKILIVHRSHTDTVLKLHCPDLRRLQQISVSISDHLFFLLSAYIRYFLFWGNCSKEVIFVLLKKLHNEKIFSSGKWSHGKIFTLE